MITVSKGNLWEHGDRAKKERGHGQEGAVAAVHWLEEHLAPPEEIEGVFMCSAQHSPATGKHAQYTLASLFSYTTALC